MFTPETVTPQNVDKLHYWLELLYFASGIVLSLLGAAALYQLIIAKRALVTAKEQLQIAADSLGIAKSDIQTRVKREAIVLAANQCEKFANEILPRCHVNQNKITAAGIEIYEWTIENTLFDETSIKERRESLTWIKKVQGSFEALSAFEEIANDYEAFSIYFAQKAADEQVAFNALGQVFCMNIQALAPYIIMLRKQKMPNVTSGPFQNLVDLYVIWSSRIKRQSLESSASIHETEANKIKQAASGIDIPKIRPLGIEE